MFSASALKSRNRGNGGGSSLSSQRKAQFSFMLGEGGAFLHLSGFRVRAAHSTHWFWLPLHTPISVGSGNAGKCSPTRTRRSVLAQVQPHFPACPALRRRVKDPAWGRVPTAAAAVRTRCLGGSLVLPFVCQRLPCRGLRECPRLPSAEEPRGAWRSGVSNPGCDLGGEQMTPEGLLSLGMFNLRLSCPCRSHRSVHIGCL